MGAGAVIAIDNLVYEDTHSHQSVFFLIFWMPFAFCMGTAGMFAAKENFRTKNPVMILFTRGVFSIFVVVSLWFCWQAVAHFGSIDVMYVAKGYFADIGHLLRTGKPLA